MYKIFISGMAYDGGKSGISVYMYNVITSLATAGHQLEILVLNSDFEKMPQHSNISYRKVPGWLGKPAVNMLWHLCVLPWRIKWKKYDFILLPAANRRALLFYRNYTLGVVHDLSQYHIECKYDAFRMFYIKRILPWAVSRMSHLAAVSGSTASDLEKYWHVPSSMISVNYNGYDRSRFFVDEKYEKGCGKDKFNLKKDYILYVSRIEYPGKNHLNLIKAYEQLPEAFKTQYDLVLGGSFWPGAEPVKEYAEKSPVKDCIKFIGFVNNAVLPDLYRDAALYIFPSLFEGFGLSLVEAMACGVPAACSNNSSLAEVGGDAVITFDPESSDDIAFVMKKMLSSLPLREDMIKRGLLRAKDFDWDEHASNLIEMYEKKA